MLTTIHITVRDRVPTITAGEDVISHNSDYVAEFEFDEEWQDKVKTVYFVCEDGSYQAVVMNGNSCDVPMLDGEHRRIFVGVQAGAAEKPSILKTTRPCCLKVKDSIADYLGQPIPDPTPDVYEQIIAMLESITSPTWDAVQDKPFSTLGSGLAVDENGVLSAEGGGGGSANAVQYVAQTLTDEQKKQARNNIGASPIPKVRYWLNLNADNIINLYNMGVGYGIISPVDYDQTVPTGMSSPMLVIFGRMNYGRVDITVYDGAGAVWSGSLNLSSQTTYVTKTGDYVTNTVLTDILQNYVPADEWYGNLSQIEQAIGTKLDKNQGAGNAGKILGIGADGIVVPQDNPTYTLPQATADALGGIKADAATAEDTQVVRIGTDGKLRTKPTGGSSITVDDALSSTSENPVQNKVVMAALAEKITAPTTATVGQIIKVKSVDSTGKPTEWEAVTAKLANPNALTFTGAVTGSYDGSEPMTVNIPSGGVGDGNWKQAGFVQSETDGETLEVSGLDTKSIRLVVCAAAYANDKNNKSAQIMINGAISLIYAGFIQLTNIKVTVIEIHLITTPSGNYIFAPNFPTMRATDDTATSASYQVGNNSAWFLLRVDTVEKIESISLACTNGTLLTGSKLNVEVI